MIDWDNYFQNFRDREDFVGHTFHVIIPGIELWKRKQRQLWCVFRAWGKREKP